MTANPRPEAGRTVAGRLNDIEALKARALTIHDPAALADPEIWPDDEEFGAFLADTYDQRRANLA